MNDRLLGAAIKAAENAYCPYSNFRVGAAVLCDDQSMVVGCNVENASYGLTICAERNAIFAAIAQGKGIVSIAVACLDADDDAPAFTKMPCGACRQVMVEFMSADADVLIYGVGGSKLGNILPQAFRLRETI